MIIDDVRRKIRRRESELTANLCPLRLSSLCVFSPFVLSVRLFSVCPLYLCIFSVCPLCVSFLRLSSLSLCLFSFCPLCAFFLRVSSLCLPSSLQITASISSPKSLNVSFINTYHT